MRLSESSRAKAAGTQAAKARSGITDWARVFRAMTMIVYKVSGAGESWAFTRNGERGAEYTSEEGAFEAAVLGATNDLRAGDEITIEVRRSDAPRETAGAFRRE
ncbi:MAG: hypothetical protein JOY97_10320 [Hyphomicrobiales bacterium]|nr:hypothetical protein [Hyphomicrobiales bacterium]